MVTGWISDGGTWYFFNAGGDMATGWKLDGGIWYYFKPSGATASIHTVCQMPVVRVYMQP